MTQREALQLARQLMAAHNVSDWGFGFNRRKRSLGLCRYGEHRIELSAHFVHANDEAAVRDTILHEIAHALAGPEAGHGSRWKSICRRIGAVPERCDRSAQMPTGRWLATCPACGHMYTRHRRPLKGRQYMCRTCGPEQGRIEFKMAASAMSLAKLREKDDR